MIHKRSNATIQLLTILLLLALGPASAVCRADQPSPSAEAGWVSYINQVEASAEHRHASQAGFLTATDVTRLRRGELVIEKITTAQAPSLPGAMLHHWRGTAYLPDAHAADFERILRDFEGYPHSFAPQVLSSHVLTRNGNRYGVLMRVEQKHILSVVLDTTYDVVFGTLDATHGFSTSRSTRIAEIEHAGESNERALTPAENHGFLWRLNTYWSYEERDRGLYLQIESVSLTRAIPPGLGWAVGPFVESVPRESLEFTLRAVCNALQKSEPGGTGTVDERKQP